jgi:hypothetical protein
MRVPGWPHGSTKYRHAAAWGRQLVTAHAGERSSVTDRARGLVQMEFASGVRVHEIRGVAGRLEGGDVLAVASLTTERVLNPAMANQTVRHLGEGRMGYAVGFFQTPVAGLARIAVVQVAANIIGGLEVVLPVDSQGEQWRHVPHPQVLSMTEADDTGGRRRRNLNLNLLVAIQTDFFRGQKVIFDSGATGSSGVALGALQIHLQVEPMRKGRGAPRGTPC